MNDTAYAIRRTVDLDVLAAQAAVTEALGRHGFGVLTTIDVAATLKKKLDADVPAYVILGACNPHLAHRGVTTEPDLGVLLPCNVVVRDEGGRTVVSAMDPVSAMELAGNPELRELASEARTSIEAALAELGPEAG